MTDPPTPGQQAMLDAFSSRREAEQKKATRLTEVISLFDCILIALSAISMHENEARPHPGKEAKRYQVEDMRDGFNDMGIKP
ncbi:hypothetical protein F4827_002977 [Paraburkholderia bannensis]|uniref:Uncharacterized protein n=1 Tax=Paraburkholderia bannensis TaxID=765414 RepID=A0A7W9WT97_9BURK|nr:MULTISPECIES: hypothetical protein [Paraburkholderia]MBB3258109.1 hypothetical protein [Paraburkholderia sp. WP4_3_2]MBB6103122.1 hypothetical protein [Paraburkholderia bannensis]